MNATTNNHLINCLLTSSMGLMLSTVAILSFRTDVYGTYPVLLLFYTTGIIDTF
jgi:hypothetical protein